MVHALRQIKDLARMTVSTANGLSRRHGTVDQILRPKLEIMVPTSW